MRQSSWTGSEDLRRPQQVCGCPESFRGNKRYVTAAESKAMPFGKHKGRPLGTIETSYLEWIIEKVDDHEELKRLIREVLSLRQERGQP